MVENVKQIKRFFDQQAKIATVLNLTESVMEDEENPEWVSRPQTNARPRRLIRAPEWLNNFLKIYLTSLNSLVSGVYGWLAASLFN